jgi:hypothetical protein
MFLSSLKAETVTEDSKRLLFLMEPSKSIYFFEPDECQRKPHFEMLEITTRRYDPCLNEGTDGISELGSFLKVSYQ